MADIMGLKGLMEESEVAAEVRFCSTEVLLQLWCP